jgi:hypothetical protein
MRILWLLLLLLAAPPALAQGPPADPPPDQACLARDWRAFWPAVRVSTNVERNNLRLLNQESTQAKAVPDGSPQRISVDRAVSAQRTFLAVWLYPAQARIEGAGRAAETTTGLPGIRLSPGVAAPAADGTQATEFAVTMPTVETLTVENRWRLYQPATLVVLGCDRFTNTVQFLATVEFELSDGRIARFAAVGVVTLIWLVAAFAARAGRRSTLAGTEGGRFLLPTMITQDASGRASLSRLQILFFTLITTGTLAYLFFRTGVVANLSADLLYLMGIAGVGSVAAQQVTAARTAKGTVPAETLVWLARHGVLRDDRRPRLRDLFFTGGEFDIYKLQNMIFSPFVGITVLAAGVQDLAALDIPDNLMALLGLSQVVYVGGKAVGPQPTVEDLVAACRRAGEAEAALAVAWAAEKAAHGPAEGIADILMRLPDQATAWRIAGRAAADCFARFADEDVQARTPLPRIEL